MTNIVPVNIPLPLGYGMPMQNMGTPGMLYGIEHFSEIEFVRIEQIKTSSNMDKQYLIFNPAGQQCFTASVSQQFSSMNGFIESVYDNGRQEVMTLERSITGCTTGCLCSGCCNGCFNTCVVTTETKVRGSPIGFLTQKGTMCYVNIDILDENHQNILKIDAPVCACTAACCSNVDDMKVYRSSNSEECGSISRTYNSAPCAVSTWPLSYTLNFGSTLSLKERQALFGALMSLFSKELANRYVQQKRR